MPPDEAATVLTEDAIARDRSQTVHPTDPRTARLDFTATGITSITFIETANPEDRIPATLMEFDREANRSGPNTINEVAIKQRRGAKLRADPSAGCNGRRTESKPRVPHGI